LTRKNGSETKAGGHSTRPATDTNRELRQTGRGKIGCKNDGGFEANGEPRLKKGGAACAGDSKGEQTRHGKKSEMRQE